MELGSIISNWKLPLCFDIMVSRLQAKSLMWLIAPVSPILSLFYFAAVDSFEQGKMQCEGELKEQDKQFPLHGQEKSVDYFHPGTQT